MGLITMGYGHPTIITMGLGNSIRIVQQEILYQAGEVTFEDVTPKVKITDQLIKASFEEEEKVIEITEQPKIVSFEAEENSEVKYD